MFFSLSVALLLALQLAWYYWRAETDWDVLLNHSELWQETVVSEGPAAGGATIVHRTHTCCHGNAHVLSRRVLLFLPDIHPSICLYLLPDLLFCHIISSFIICLFQQEKKPIIYVMGYIYRQMILTWQTSPTMVEWSSWQFGGHVWTAWFSGAAA